MTVADLIEKLQVLPLDSQVIVESRPSTTHETSVITSARVAKVQGVDDRVFVSLDLGATLLRWSSPW